MKNNKDSGILSSTAIGGIPPFQICYQPFSPSIFLLAILSSTFLFRSPLYSQTPEELKSRFLEEAPGRWEEYRTFAGHLQGEITKLEKIEGKVVRLLRWTVKQNGKCRLLIDQSEKKDTTKGFLSAYNDEYFFSLQRRSVDFPWVISTVKLRREQPHFSTEVNRVNKRLCITSYLIRLFSEDLPDVVSMPSFRVLRVTPVVRNGDALVQVEFDNAHPVEKVAGQPYCPIQKGTMLLDPNRYWCLRVCDIHNKYLNEDARIKIETEVSESQSGHPIPKRWVASQETSNAPLLSMVMNFTLEKPSRLPSNEEFTLSAFDLPEPPSLEQKHIRWYLWLAAAGFTCILLAAAIRRLARRSS